MALIRTLFVGVVGGNFQYIHL